MGRSRRRESRVRRSVLVLIVAFFSLAILSTPSTAEASEHPALRRAAHVVVDLSEQRAYVYDAQGLLMKVILVSTGGPGYRTRVGSFLVTTRTRVGRAGGNSDVRMDYFTRFDKSIGFHGIPWRGSRNNRLATPLGQKGVSHGCIRMADSNARWLYLELKEGDLIEVKR